MKTFAEMLKELLDMTQANKKDVAARAGVSAGYISLLSSGERKTPSVDTVLALANAFTVSREKKIELLEVAGYLDAADRLPADNRKDWGEAPRVERFHGREKELKELQRWIVYDNCQMVTIVGIGGVGKTALATCVAEKIQDEFEYVIWRSLRNAPSIEKLLKECIHLFSDGNSSVSSIISSEGVDTQIALLIECLQQHRCLIVLDNFESILKDRSSLGEYKEGHDKYGVLLQSISGIKHQSCLLLTSREKPREMLGVEGKASHVRSILLEGVELTDARKILAEKELIGTDEDWNKLIHLYSGNPLALKLVSESINAIFDGAIASFLKEDESVFGGINNLLNEQFSRLSELERDIVYWLAIGREEMVLDDLKNDLARPVANRELFEALEALRRRAMIEARSMIEPFKTSLFTLQPVIMEYVTERFVEQVTEEIFTEKIFSGLFTSHALIKALANDYIRDIQTKLVLHPISSHLLEKFERNGSEKKLKKILVILHDAPAYSSYAAGNLLNLLVYLNIDITGYDFSHLSVHQAYLQGVSLRDVNFEDADLSKSVFTDTFGSIFSVALSANNGLLAAGTANGEIRVWNMTSITPLNPLRGHTEWVRSVAFSPNQQRIASGSEDQTVRLWNVNTSTCFKILRGHEGRIYSVAYSPDGSRVISGSEDQTIRIWDAETGDCLNTLQGHDQRVYSVAYSRDGNMIVSGGGDGAVRLWDAHRGTCLNILQGHSLRVRSVAFNPDSTLIVSGGDDRIVQLWDVKTGDTVMQLQGHEDRVWSVAFSPDGKSVASGSEDQTIRIWDAVTGQCQQKLLRERREGDARYGNRVYAVAFGSDSNLIVSGCDGQTVRLWNIHKGECLKSLQGHGSRVYAVAFGPENTVAGGYEDRMVRLWDANNGDWLKTLQGHSHWIWSVAFSNKDGSMLASGSEDQTVRLWNTRTNDCLRVLSGHTQRVYSVAFGPDDLTIASSSGDQTIKLWSVSTGKCLHTLEGHRSRVYSVAFSDDGKTIASGSDDQTVKLWDVSSGSYLRTFTNHMGRIRSVAFSPSGKTIAVGSEDSTVKLLDVATGNCIRTFYGHKNWVWSIAFSPDGKRIVSGSEDSTVKLWDVDTGVCLQTFNGHEGTIYSVVFNSTGTLIASGGLDGVIIIWSEHTGKICQTLRSDRPYERLRIKGVKGLTLGQKTILKELGAKDE